MGEAKHRSQARQALIAAEPRCIYCPAPATTVEHMPPVGMFRGRQRPGAMEYAACAACNEGTRGSDAVAALLARMDINIGEGGWQAGEIRKLRSAVERQAPGVLEELSLPNKFRHEWMRRPNSGILQKVVRVHADGPLLQAHLSAFGAKLAMALYREHVGVALPVDGRVWCQFALNAGMTQEDLDARVRILPIHGTLRQGRKHVGDQFAYRYNCDERTVVAAVVQFHRGLWFTLFASSDPKIIDLITSPTWSGLPASFTVAPGRILALLPAPPTASPPGVATPLPQLRS